MPRTENWTNHVPVEHNQENATGVITQGSNGTRSSVLFAANDDIIFGAPVKVVVKGIVAADVAYDAAGAIHNVLSKPELANKYRVVSVQTVARVFRTGGTPVHNVKVEVGDGAASEAFTNAVASVDITAETVGLPAQRIMVNSVATVWSSGRTLRCQLEVSGTTTGATAEVDFVITLMPTNEATA